MVDGLGFGKQKLVAEIVKKNWRLKSELDKNNYTYHDVLYIIQEMLDNEGKKYLEGGRYSINYGFEAFRKFVELLIYRNLANYDSMVLLTGVKGTGKSSAAMMIARLWCNILGIRFDPARHMAYNNADVMQKIDQLNKFEPLVCLSGKTKIDIKLNGKIYKETIANLIKINDYEVLTYNIDKNIYEYQKPEKTVLTNKRAKVFEIELENGEKITSTEDHLFLTKNGYKKLKELTKEDEIIIKHKNCTICNKEFYNIKMGGKQKYCSKVCAKEGNSSKYFTEEKRIKVRKQYKKHYDKNSKEILKQNKIYEKSEKGIKTRKEWEIKTKEDRKIKSHIYWETNKIELSKKKSIYDKNHRKELNEKDRKYYRKKFDTDLDYRLRHNYSTRMYDAVKNYKDERPSNFVNELGCSIKELRNYLESQFDDIMSWSNYGKWHVDHIKPISKCDFKNKEQRLIYCHYTNLQPLWKKDNCSKGAKEC